MQCRTGRSSLCLRRVRPRGAGVFLARPMHLSRIKYVLASLITITAVVVFMLVLAHSTLGYDPLDGLSHVFSSDYSAEQTGSGVSVPSAAASAKTKTAPQTIPPTWPAKFS